MIIYSDISVFFSPVDDNKKKSMIYRVKDSLTAR